MRRRLGVIIAIVWMAALASGCAQATPESAPQVVPPLVATSAPQPIPNTPTPTAAALKPAATAAATATPTAAPVTRATAVTKPNAAPLTLKVTTPVDESVVNTAVITVAGQTTPGAVVSIDGDLVDVDASGKFQAQVSLEEGPNVLEITASDDKGSEVSSVVRLVYEP